MRPEGGIVHYRCRGFWDSRVEMSSRREGGGYRQEGKASAFKDRATRCGLHLVASPCYESLDIAKNREPVCKRVCTYERISYIQSALAAMSR
jgi:hypothetical protein